MKHHALVVFNGFLKKQVVGVWAIVLLTASKHVEMVETLKLQHYLGCHGVVHVFPDKHPVKEKRLINIQVY